MGTTTLDIQSHVIVSDKYVPLTGIYSLESEVSGWKWDRRRLESFEDIKTFFDTYVGGQVYGLLDGTLPEDWQSGVVTGIEYNDLSLYRSEEETIWTPRVHTGAYSIYFDSRLLYSDYSYSEIVDTANNANGVNVIALRSDCIEDSISVSIWERANSALIFHRHNFEMVEEFTGEIDGTERLPTVEEDGDIIWANLSERKKEFLIEDGVVYLNGNYRYVVGPVISGATAGEVRNHYEDQGDGIDEERDLYLRVFPILSGTVRLWVITAGVVEEWTEVDSLNTSNSTNKHFVVDHDLGIVTVGGFLAPELILLNSITDSSVAVSVYPDPEVFAQYPEYGVIKIGTEKIYYEEKGTHSFRRCTRGYGATTPAAHSQGDVVEDIQHGMESTEDDSFYVTYVAVPKIEYEVTEHQLRSANKSPLLDISPLTNIETNNILQIRCSEPNIQEIVLSTDAPLIGGNLYGPLYFGTDTSVITATAYDVGGRPVEDVEITIEITSGGGRLAGSTDPIEKFTNSRGQIYTSYNAPYTNTSVQRTVSLVTHSAGDTLMSVSGLPHSVTPDEITVFQILKHDRVTGGLGLESQVVVADPGDAERGLGKITIAHRVDQLFVGGTLRVLGVDLVMRTVTIKQVYDALLADVPISILYVDEELDGVDVDGQPCWLYEPDAEDWDANDLNGIRVLLYEWRADIPHPLTEELGAWFPVRPTSISSGVLTFSGIELPLPDPDNTSSNLGGYIVVAPMIAVLHATGRDPMSGRVVSSNRIRLLVDLPQYLYGVDSSGELPIPYGFTFVTEDFNVGTGIGGSNFLTVNPRAMGISQFNLTAEV